MFEMPRSTFKLGPLLRFYIVLPFVPEYRRNAARHIKINDTTIILHPKGHHYCIFLSFRFHWALLACLRWSLGTLGLPWVPLDGHCGSICDLWGSIGAPLGRHWALFVRLWGSIGAPLGVIGDHFGGHFDIILYPKHILSTFISFVIFVSRKKPAMKRPKCEKTFIFVGPNRGV